MLRERRRAANFKPNRRLDRKSSRGMIYENEELRLRTININAEVERGQSDIRKLRRENEQLRREIWTLRDEYDRLDKMLHQHKSHGDSHHHNNHNHQHQHGERNCCGDDEECDGEEGEEQENEDEDEEEEQEDEDGECCSCNRSGGGEDRCEECDSGDDYCDDENCNCCGAEDSTCDNPKGATAPPATTTVEGGGGASASTRHLNGGTTNGAKLREHLHVNFDHLSIVSEENLTGSDGSNSVQNLPADQDCLTVPPPGPAKDGKDSSAAAAAFLPHSPMSIMSLPATPCSPLLTDFQSLVPPLKHFENINYDDIKPLSHSSIASSASERPPSALVQSPSFVATASAASSPSFATARAPGRATDDVPSKAPSPEPPDSRQPPSPSPSPPGTPPLSSTSLSSLPIVLASSVSSSDWMWNNKTVSFSTFRPPTASVSQPSLLTSPHPYRKCDNSRPGQQQHQQQPEEQGEIVAINPMMPKHFFSPLRPSRQMLLPSSPDLYVHDVLASPSGSSLSINEAQQTTRVVVEPIYSSIHKSRPSYPLSITCTPAVVGGAVDNPLYVSQTSPVASSGSFANPVPGAASADGVNVSRAPLRSPTVFQIGGNLEELLQDIEGAAEEVAQLEISGQEVDGFSRLVAPVSSATCSSELTPPPNVPEPMNLLPATLPYLDFKSNTAVITTPQAALANRSSSAAGAGAMNGNTTTTVTSVVSKPISSATAVRKKLFGKTNKEPVINEPGHDHRTPAVVPLKITIPGGEASAGAGAGTGAVDDKVVPGQNSDKATSPVVRRRERRPEDEAETPSNQSSTAAVGKRKSRRIPLSFPGFGGSGKKSVQEDEKDTSSLENLASNQTPAAAVAAAGTPATTPSGKSGKPSLHRVSSGADISSISTSIGSPSTPVKGPCHHHRHSSQKGGRGKGRPGHSRTSSESQNIYASPNHGHHGCDLRRNSGMNDALTTSMSERNSNSLASSRESSTSLSMRSHKSRRISENSHSGGKIPWCGCWGNGCL